MKGTMNRILVLCTVFTFAFSGISFGSVNRSVSVDDLKTIQADEMPSGIIPKEFSSDEEAVKYLNKVYASMSIENGREIPETRSTNGNVTVATQRLGVLGGSISLKLRYGTSGDNHTGMVTYADPYTTTSGITYSFDWREDSIGAEISSSGKDVYVYTDGVIIAYLLIDGLIKIDETPVSLSGYVPVIH